MSYTTVNTVYSFFPTAPAAPNGFALFGQSPRDTHATYEDFRNVLRPSNQTLQTKRSSGSVKKSGLKKFWGGA